MEIVKLFDNTILDLANIKLKSDQRPEDLYQCLMSLGPFQRQMKNFPLPSKILSSLCLQLLHPSLPRLVKQRYGTELCSRTLASVKPEISQALDPLLEELHTRKKPKLCVLPFLILASLLKHPATAHPHTNYHFRPNPNLLTASRNAPPCDDPRCQICSFVSQAEDSVVRPISFQRVLSGPVALPFTTRSVWLHTQQECPALRRVHSHL